MTYSRRTWVNGNAWDATAANDFEGRVETEFVLKSNAVSASASLPGSPVDGQELYYLADTTNGVVWHLRYRSGSASAYKWEFVGGGALYSEVTTVETTTSGTFVDLATVGPSITLPLAGDYDYDFSALESAASQTAIVGAKFGAAAVSLADEAFVTNSASGNSSSIASGQRRKLALAASTVVKLQYTVTGGATATFQQRHLAIMPVRVG